MSHRLRILLVSHKYPPHALGGVEVYAYHLAQALKERHRVAVFYRHDEVGMPAFSAQDEEVDGVLSRRVSWRPTGAGASVAGEFLSTFLNAHIESSFAQFVEEFQPDLIHFQHVMALSARLLDLAVQAGVPALLTLHDYWFICGNSQLIWPDGQTCRGKAWGMNCVRCAAAARFPSRLVPWLRPFLAPLFLYRDRVVSQAAERASLLISPSRFLIQQYVAAGLPAERLVFLENGLPVDHIRKVAREPADGPLRVAFLGSLAWQKGVHVLAEAFGQLPEGVARLRIWGDPDVFPEYGERLRGLAQRSDAELMGRVANEQIGDMLADTDVLVVPSLWYENSPMVIQEARAAGVPVVVSGHGALAEKVQNGVDGLHFPPGDAGSLCGTLQRLAAEADLLPRLRGALPAPMGINEHVRKVEELYGNVLRRSARSPA
ncbi:glycosyltransferase family 4 protein [Chloroflexota bacterium]